MVDYLYTRIKNHQRTNGNLVIKDTRLMSIAWESELIEIANGECLSHSQLQRHIKLLHDIIGSYDMPTFQDMLAWHEYLLQDQPFAGKIRKFPAGRYTRNGWAKYPTVHEESVERMFEVFSQANQHPMLAIAHFHIYLTETHPFIDGNGRVCRLVLNAHLHQAGYGMCLISRDNKDEYLTFLENRDTTGLALFIESNLVM